MTTLIHPMLASGALPASVEVRFLPGWRSPEAIAALEPAAVRRALQQHNIS